MLAARGANVAVAQRSHEPDERDARQRDHVQADDHRLGSLRRVAVVRDQLVIGCVEGGRPEQQVPREQEQRGEQEPCERDPRAAHARCGVCGAMLGINHRRAPVCRDLVAMIQGSASGRIRHIS